MKSLKGMIDGALILCKTKTQLARILGDTPQTLYNYEVGRRHMPDDKIVKLAKLAGVNPTLALGQYQMDWLKRKKKTARRVAGLDLVKR